GHVRDSKIVMASPHHAASERRWWRRSRGTKTTESLWTPCRNVMPGPWRRGQHAMCMRAAHALQASAPGGPEEAAPRGHHRCRSLRLDPRIADDLAPFARVGLDNLLHPLRRRWNRHDAEAEKALLRLGHVQHRRH